MGAKKNKKLRKKSRKKLKPKKKKSKRTISVKTKLPEIRGVMLVVRCVCKTPHIIMRGGNGESHIHTYRMECTNKRCRKTIDVSIITSTSELFLAS